MLNREVGREESAGVMNVSPRGLKAFWHSLDKRVSERASARKKFIECWTGFYARRYSTLERRGRQTCANIPALFSPARCWGVFRAAPRFAAAERPQAQIPIVSAIFLYVWARFWHPPRAPRINKIIFSGGGAKASERREATHTLRILHATSSPLIWLSSLIQKHLPDENFCFDVLTHFHIITALFCWRRLSWAL